MTLVLCLTEMAVLLSTAAVTKPRLELFSNNGVTQEISSNPFNIFNGLLRLDLNQASVQTIYVTVWASPNVSDMGKIENADELWKNHIGVCLQPPTGEDRASEFGKWEEREIKVSGTSRIDIAMAGLGWFFLGLRGEATLTLWTYDGIEITLREPLVLDRAPFLERPGFLLPKATSDAIGNQTKLEVNRRKKLQESSLYFLAEVSA